MMQLSYEEKFDLMRSLNWDSLDTCEDMLAIVEGKIDHSNFNANSNVVFNTTSNANSNTGFNADSNANSNAAMRDRLFIRSLERLPWHYVTALWGVEAIKELYTPEIANRIWPKERRRHFDFALAVLRKEPIPFSRWGIEYFTSKRHRFFSEMSRKTKLE